MKILFLSSGLASEYGGAAVSEASLCARLQEQMEIRVLCRESRLNRSFTRGFGLQYVRAFHPLDVWLANVQPGHWLHELFDEVDVFHLNGHWRWENYHFVRLCRKKGIPYVLHPRGMFWVGHRKVFLKRIFNLVWGKQMARFAGRVIALSRFEVDQFKPYLLKEEQVAVVPNGITPPLADGLLARKTLVPSGKSYFLYFGRIEKRKNLVFLVRAFAHYLKAGGNSELCFMGPTENNYSKDIRKAARKLGIENRVHFFEPVYDQSRWAYIRSARAVIYPTVNEPFGRVPFEALAAGGFPIIPKESGSAEYLSQFIPYCIYAHNDKNSLAETMSQVEKAVSTRDNRVLGAIGRARLWVSSELAWERVGNKVIEIYKSLRRVDGGQRKVEGA